MIENNDRVLLCLSGGKDSLSMLHAIHQYQFYAKSQVRIFVLLRQRPLVLLFYCGIRLLDIYHLLTYISHTRPTVIILLF